MREPATGSYRDADGHRHELVVRESAEGGWNVLDLDIEADTAHLVEALSDEQDGRPQAEAIARDYLAAVGGLEPGTGLAGPEAIPEQGGSDDRSHRHAPATRRRRPRGAALPGAAR
jgi:hypothetical protein